MTESQWLDGDQFARMLRFLKGTASARQLRWLGCACCRMVWQILSHDLLYHIVEVAERFAEQPDIPVPSSQRLQLVNETRRVRWKAPQNEFISPILWLLSGELTAEHVIYLQQKIWLASELSADKANRRLVGLARDIFGNPFRPFTFDPSWRSDDVMALALAAFEERSLPEGHLEVDRLAVLADALEDAGCTIDALLSHLRGPGVHVRGCWALDLILGRS